MSLDVEKRTIEVETLVGTRSAQALLRAEALVPGAGRDAIVPLLADASVILGEVDLQKDRLVIEGTLSCQGVYRQGEETTLRALAVQTSFSQVLEIVGTESGLFSRVDASAEHVEARYENGHMIFQVTVRLNAQVLKLSPVEVIVGLSASEDIQANGQYILAQPEGEDVGFYKATTGTIKAGKAYLESASGVKAFYFAGDEATGIAEVENAVENRVIYNLAGQRLQKMQKGINIMNGKKVLVK